MGEMEASLEEAGVEAEAEAEAEAGEAEVEVGEAEVEVGGAEVEVGEAEVEVGSRGGGGGGSSQARSRSCGSQGGRGREGGGGGTCLYSRAHRCRTCWTVETISPSTTRLKTNPHVEKASSTTLCPVGASGGKPVCVPGSKKMPHASHRASEYCRGSASIRHPSSSSSRSHRPTAIHANAQLRIRKAPTRTSSVQRP